MIISPRYANYSGGAIASRGLPASVGHLPCTGLWRWRHIAGALRPYNSDYIAGYLVPLIFILYFIGISRLGHVLIRISWSVSAFLLVAYNRNFLQGVQTEYSCHLCFPC
jgi:hypothetical protein